MLVLDVDGILTDCKIFLDSNNDWKRIYSVRDGVGIKALIEANYKVAIITGANAIDVRERVKNLGIHYLYEGRLDKSPAFEDLKKETGINSDEIAYMGDDHFDIPVLEQVGFAATVSDAMEEVFKSVDYVARRPAGNGAVREICDYILQHGFYAKNN